jgi:hypothetical protein
MTEDSDQADFRDRGDRIFTTPALVDGALYVRTQNHLYAFGESAASPAKP